MSTVRPRESSIKVIPVEIDGTAALSTALVKPLDDALNQAEDVGEAALLMVRVVGSEDPATPHRWPGQANTQAVSKWERALRRMERAASSTLVLAEKNCSRSCLGTPTGR